MSHEKYWLSDFRPRQHLSTAGCANPEQCKRRSARASRGDRIARGLPDSRSHKQPDCRRVSGAPAVCDAWSFCSILPLASLIDEFDPALVVMAGFMRVLTGAFSIAMVVG